MSFKVFDSRQDWLDARKGTIGGSDAACIMGLNPWKTNQQLWKEIAGIEEPAQVDNDAIQFGIGAEPHLRALFQLEHPEWNVEYAENNLWTSDVYPFAHASLDGWLQDDMYHDKGILEIKTASPKNAAGWAEWKDRIPDRYYCQCLHYLGTLPHMEFVYLFAYLRHYGGRAELREYRIDREEVEPDVIALMKAESDFMESVRTGKMPGRIIQF